MSKQEVIEIIAGELIGAWRAGDGRSWPPDWDCGQKAEALYDRIAPLMVREYPEQKILAGVNRIFNHLEAVFEVEIVGSVNMRGMLNGMFRQFWEGQPKVGDNILEQERQDDINKAKNKDRSRVLTKIAQAKPKGTCRKCGGSKRVPDYDNIDQKLGTIYTKDCPDCAGTGECQHKGEVRYPCPKSEGWLPWCPDCKSYFEQRNRKERRQLWGGCGRRRGVSLGSGRRRTDCAMQDDRRILADRRKAG